MIPDRELSTVEERVCVGSLKNTKMNGFLMCQQPPDLYCDDKR